ncbi:MAG: HAMP domain-containing histidine kinase [Labilithrix sp.]|nr:HAMP domain-containing histidine kinase [Labilithrix sp.]
MADPTTMSLPAAKDLRARADRVIAGAALRGTPRSRFLREQRRRVAARLLPTLALVAVATGTAAVVDLLQVPAASRAVTLAQGLTATLLAGLALGCTVARRSYVALMAIAVSGVCTLLVGWAIVTAGTGGAKSAYALSVPLGLTVLVISVPLLPWHVPLVAAVGAVAFGLAAPGAPPSAFLLFALLGGGGFVLARTRRRRALHAFRRVERLAAAVARIRRVQDQLVVVEKLEALRVLVGGMAHELNNALAVSLASTEQIVSVAERDPPAAAKAAERAQRGLVRIRATIDRLKRFAMAEEGVLEPADLAAMLDFALESAIGRARSGVMIDRSYEEGLPPIDTHVAALAEALFQVARNAVESMPKGGTIRASLRRAGDRVELAVADQGQGIPPARLAKVFDPFYARETADATFSGGRLLASMPGRSGLGLSAVYGLVSAIGGRVEIRSEVGRGTEVVLSLPSAPARRSSRAPATRA